MPLAGVVLDQVTLRQGFVHVVDDQLPRRNRLIERPRGFGIPRLQQEELVAGHAVGPDAADLSRDQPRFERLEPGSAHVQIEYRQPPHLQARVGVRQRGRYAAADAPRPGGHETDATQAATRLHLARARRSQTPVVAILHAQQVRRFVRPDAQPAERAGHGIERSLDTARDHRLGQEILVGRNQTFLQIVFGADAGVQKQDPVHLAVVVAAGRQAVRPVPVQLPEFEAPVAQLFERLGGHHARTQRVGRSEEGVLDPVLLEPHRRRQQDVHLQFAARGDAEVVRERGAVVAV